jgi:hypothetical protein
LELLFKQNYVLPKVSEIMITDNQIPSIIETLMKDNSAVVAIEGMSMRLSLWNDGQIIHLSTPVYHGENYIPPSVKDAIKQPFAISSERFEASFKLDETTCFISLESLGTWAETAEDLKLMLYEFASFAEEWKNWLNEKGKGDLLPIYLKK